MKLELIPITQDGRPEKEVQDLPEEAVAMGLAMKGLYRKHGYTSPWIGYLAIEDGRCAGTCAFKAPPKSGVVEIAYYTFEGYEGRGVATRMVELLLEMVKANRPYLIVAAHTLPEKNASNVILGRLGFQFVGTVEHPEDGTVWEWRWGWTRRA